MPSAVTVVARSYPDRIIGIENKLPWHLGTDLKNFKSLTQDHAIIMGRKTFESIGRPLPRRVNIVLSRERLEDEENVKWAQDPETALLLADFYSISMGKSQFFIIGGENIYDVFNKYINSVFLTEVNTGPINGDAKFDYDFDPKEWYFKFEREFPKSEIDDFSFRISYLVRRRREHRQRFISEFKESNPLFEMRWDEFAEGMPTRVEQELEKQQLDFIERL
ncbi:dihydrofolate reductase [Neorhizobium sp. Rsf11]|uniref:dihydrofolate reductase n=1 Tax=Neorhizobium phenanthreniclasticum TaxID=3157917 RepID=A0ABV0M1W8_9HYPH